MFDKRSDTVVHEHQPYNAEPAPDALAAARLTPYDTFYSRNHGPLPEVDHDTWRLVVDGLVEEPLSLGLSDLTARFAGHTVEATMQCAGNRRAELAEVAEIPGEDPWREGAIGSATWTGVRLADVLDAAGVRPGAAHVAFEAPDVSTIPDEPAPYGSSIDLDKALRPEVLVATAMNGAPLSRLHGAPARIVVPAYIGARSVKWVRSITVQATPSANYFQATAYRLLPADADPDAAGPGDGISLGPWALNCAVLSPARGARVAPGPCEVLGYAVAAEHRTVAVVEVSVDDGRTWTTADWDDEPAPFTWRRWRARVDLIAGERRILARAWDDSGALQPRDAADLWNPKGYANTAWPRVPVEVLAAG